MVYVQVCNGVNISSGTIVCKDRGLSNMDETAKQHPPDRMGMQNQVNPPDRMGKKYICTSVYKSEIFHVEIRCSKLGASPLWMRPKAVPSRL